MIFFYFLIGTLPMTQLPFLTRFVGGDITLMKFLGGVCTLFALFHLMVKRLVPPVFGRGPGPWAIAFCMVGFISAARGDRPFMFSRGSVPALISCILLLTITPILIDTYARLRTVLPIVIASVAFASVFVIREWVKWHDVYANFRGWGGVTDDPNYFSLTAIIWLPLSFALARFSDRRWERYFCWGSLVTILLAVTLAASRGGFLGLVAGLLYLVGRSKQRVRNFAIISAVVLPLIAFSPSSPLRRLTQPNNSDDEAQKNRVVVWKAGWRMFKDHPVAGVGIDTFVETSVRYQQGEEKPVWSLAHNTYIQIGSELGLLGFVPFLGLFFSTYATLRRVGRWAAQQGFEFMTEVSIAMQAGLVALMVGIFFISGLQRTFWLLVALTITLTCFQARGITAEAVAPGRSNA
jgi:putative inorganic carbon (HCO3(-)) transporter